MTTPLQALILGADFQADATAAVADEVCQADAAGLPKAYEPDFTPRQDHLLTIAKPAK